MQRYNIFKQAHKGLKAMLFDLALQFQQADVEEAAQVQPLLATMDEVLTSFQQQVRQHATLIIPVLQQINPKLATDFVAENERHTAMVHQLFHLIPVYEREVSAADKQVVGEAIVSAFNDFVNIQLQHLQLREDTINRILWPVLPDDALLALHRVLLACSAATCNDYSNRWIIKGISNVEMVGWIREIEHTAPVSALKELLLLAEKELPAHRWQLVKDSLAEGCSLP